MPSRDSSYWTYLQALAWIQWRRPGIERYFADQDAPQRWRASKIYPDLAISAPGLPHLTAPPVCQNAKEQFDLAIRDASIDVYSVERLAASVIDSAARSGLTFHLNSTATRGAELVVSEAVFEAHQIRGMWPETSPSVEGRASDLKAVEEWLRGLMKGPRPADTTKVRLRKDAPRAISNRAWDELYARVAREVNPNWSRAGRRSKS